MKFYFLLLNFLAAVALFLNPAISIAALPVKFNLVQTKPVADCFFGKPDMPCRDDIWEILPTDQKQTADFAGYLLPLHSNDLATNKMTSFILKSSKEPIDWSDAISPWYLHDVSSQIVHDLNFKWGVYNLFLRSFWAVWGAGNDISELRFPRVYVVSQFRETRYVVWISWVPAAADKKLWEPFMVSQAAEFSNCKKKQTEKICRENVFKQYGEFFAKIDLTSDFKELSKILDSTFNTWTKMDKKQHRVYPYSRGG